MELVAMISFGISFLLLLALMVIALCFLIWLQRVCR